MEPRATLGGGLAYGGDGRIALDATELGLRTSWSGNAIGAHGKAQPTLFVAGPLARGTFGELMGRRPTRNSAEVLAR